MSATTTKIIAPLRKGTFAKALGLWLNLGIYQLR